MIAKILAFVKAHHSDITLAICIVLITIISFNMGRASVIGQSEGAGIAGPQTSTASRTAPRVSITPKKPAPTRDVTNEPVYASKSSSSKVYHFSWCSGASKITDKNKLAFPNESAAIAAGYTLAGNCKK